jgi:hypothetical protein
VGPQSVAFVDAHGHLLIGEALLFGALERRLLDQNPLALKTACCG